MKRNFKKKNKKIEVFQRGRSAPVLATKKKKKKTTAGWLVEGVAGGHLRKLDTGTRLKSFLSALIQIQPGNCPSRNG